jgi:hypothetical protein
MRGRSLYNHAFRVVGLTTAAVAAGLALGSSPSAVAASPSAPCNSPSAQVISCHFTDSFADTDFCGTGQPVDLAFDGRFTVPVAPNTSGGSWNNSESHAILTNPATGVTVLVHSAYRFTSTVISGDPNGVHTVQAVFAGDAETIRDAHGGVLARDAGNLVVEATFSGGDFVSAEIVSNHGGHSLFANGDCSVLVPALGLT